MPQLTPLLIIDDDAELCALLNEFLAREGFSVAVEHDGARGLETAFNGKFSLVVLDLMLPTMDGFQVLKELRGQSRMPVLMLTARGDPGLSQVLHPGPDTGNACPNEHEAEIAVMKSLKYALEEGGGSGSGWEWRHRLPARKQHQDCSKPALRAARMLWLQ